MRYVYRSLLLICIASLVVMVYNCSCTGSDGRTSCTGSDGHTSSTGNCSCTSSDGCTGRIGSGVVVLVVMVVLVNPRSACAARVTVVIRGLQ